MTQHYALTEEQKKELLGWHAKKDGAIDWRKWVDSIEHQTKLLSDEAELRKQTPYLDEDVIQAALANTKEAIPLGVKLCDTLHQALCDKSQNGSTVHGAIFFFLAVTITSQKNEMGLNNLLANLQNLYTLGQQQVLQNMVRELFAQGEEPKPTSTH